MNSKDFLNLVASYQDVYIKEESEESIIISYLLDEGYVDDIEAALNIMECMSDEWKYDIYEEVNATEVAKLRRQMSDALRKNNQDEVKKIAQRLSEIQPGTQAKISAALKDKKPQSTSTTSPQKPRDVVSGLSSPSLRDRLARQATAIINSRPDNPNRPARMSTHVNRSGEVVPNISQQTGTGIDPSKYTNQTRQERRRPARQQTPQRGMTASDPSRPITTRNQST